MVPEFRNRFNHDQFTPQRYQAFLKRLDEQCGTPVTFRNCETPCFFPAALLDTMADYGREMITALLSDRDYLAASAQTIPPAYRVANDDAHPLFVQVDFGLDADLQPKLVEIQGFPSLYAYQPLLAETYREAYGLGDDLRSTFTGLESSDAYARLLRAAIVGAHDSENVILMEIEPEKQKTLPDFLRTEQLCGIPTVCLTTIEKQGNRLYYSRNGQRIPITRIYNRVIVDELERKGITPPFDFRDDLDVEWAGHPNWYFRISKFSLPYLQHPAVPRAQFLDQIAQLPDDLENYVLKPLFSFAGLGVRVGPTRDEIAAISDPAHYLLQERVDFAPLIETPAGKTKAEIRIMYIWLDELRPVTTLIRMGRGKMMGVDQNRDAEWIGASAAFFID